MGIYDTEKALREALSDMLEGVKSVWLTPRLEKSVVKSRAVLALPPGEDARRAALEEAARLKGEVEALAESCRESLGQERARAEAAEDAIIRQRTEHTHAMKDVVGKWQAVLRQREAAEAEVARLLREVVVTCVYCGHAYPPGSPTQGATVLTEHIKVCSKHPLRAAEAEVAALREEIRRIERQAEAMLRTTAAEIGKVAEAKRNAYEYFRDVARAALARGGKGG